MSSSLVQRGSWVMSHHVIPLWGHKAQHAGAQSHVNTLTTARPLRQLVVGSLRNSVGGQVAVVVQGDVVVGAVRVGAGEVVFTLPGMRLPVPTL